MTAQEKFRALLKQDGRYDPEVYSFVYEALDYTLKHVVSARHRKGQHVTGKELLEGVRQYALQQFGCLARTVLETWGVTKTDDFGEIVFRLVEHDLMGKQDEDRPEDFRAVYDFEDVLEVAPVFSYHRERGEWETTYVPRKELERTARLSSRS